MSISDSDPENEQCIIMTASRSNAPPRKKRRLNTNQAHPSSEENKSESDLELSDKENNTYTNTQINSRKRRRNTSQSSESYQFGNQKYDIPLSISPGAVIRLKLENFLCHDNFEISFHPNVNIIHGQNGAGKSAIEAGISMGLGQNSKKTGRGKSIMDVIKDGKTWSKITLSLYNQGPEKLPDFGSEIIIERRLSKTGKTGASYFKVFDGSTLKTKGKGVKFVKQIADKFNLNVDNPCVILKQSVAKEFLNSTKASDKFNFFMQASKLGNYVSCLDEARDNVRQAQEQQKQTKGSFVAIKNQYYEAKQKLDTLEQMESQKNKVAYWKRAEKYMIYHKEKDTIDKFGQDVENIESKILKSKQQLEKLKCELKLNIGRCKSVKEEIEMKSEETIKYKKPINLLKKKQKELERERRGIASNVSNVQKYIDKSKRKIRDFKRQYENCVQSMNNNARGSKLAAICEKLNKYSTDLGQYRIERDNIIGKCDETIEMKDNKQKLSHQKTLLYNIQSDINKLNGELNGLNNSNNRSEKFLDPKLKMNNNNNNNNRNQISIYAIKKALERNRRKFKRMPIGPLGEYIQLVDFNSIEMNARNIQIVQNVLQNSMYVFLVSDSRDMEIFGRIMQQTFHKTVPCIQYKYSNKMEIINENPFKNYQTNDVDGPLIRVSDMFTISDSNSWIYNAIITNSQPERIYAYGDLRRAKTFLNSLNESKKRLVNSIMTYRENNGFYKVKKNKTTISGTPQRQMNPILQSDKEQQKQWYVEKLNAAINEEKTIQSEIHSLQIFIRQSDKCLREYKQKLNKFNKNIKSFEYNIEKLQRQQTDIQEEEEGDEGLNNQLQELKNDIEDENLNIKQFEDEIQPFKNKNDELFIELADTKKELKEMEMKVKNERHKLDSERTRFETIMSQIKKQQNNISKIPFGIKKFENQLADNVNKYENEKVRINGLLNDAKALGDEITQENYPRNDRNRNRKFSLRNLKRAREILESEIEAWENELESDENDADNIRRRFENIRPKYEQHQERVDNANSNCDEMARQLHHRMKNYHEMKISVRDRLSLEFKYIMQQQGHDGKLAIDYENGTLDMICNMQSHDGMTQVRNTKTLSGGERSYAQVALIMALQKFSGSPMCIYDEFDVFMDSVNRGNSIKILLNAALGQDKRKSNQNKRDICGGERQYIFITPNDVSPIMAEGHKNEVRIHQLKAPRRH